MKNILFAVFIFITAIGCKISQKSQDNSIRGNIGNLTFPTERTYLQSEINIGLRVCQALKKKRDYFQTFYDKTEQASLEGEMTDCQGATTTDSTFTATIGNSGSNLEFISIAPRDNYFRDIQTDQSGALNDLCTSLIASGNVSNTVKSGSIKYTVNFLIADSYDRFDILKEVSDGKGGFTVTGAESTLLFTNTTQTSTKFIGVEKERTRYITCSGNQVQSMKQVWKAALTNF